MQFLIIDAAPDPTFDHEADYAGACVSCWIKDQTADNAFRIARCYIEEHGWVVLEKDEHYPITAEAYENNPHSKKYFNQALIDEEVFVFHTYCEG